MTGGEKTKQNTIQIIVLILAVFGFLWGIWQHEVLVWDWVHSAWNEPHALFSGIIVTKGLAYDLTLFLTGVMPLVMAVALWTWNTPQVQIAGATTGDKTGNETDKQKISMVILGSIIILILVVTSFIALARDQFNVDLLPQAKNLFFSVIVALIFGLGSYAKNLKPETFDPVKFSVTLILSLVVGFAMFYFKLDYSTATIAVESFFAQSGLVTLIEVWLKAIWRTIERQPAG